MENHFHLILRGDELSSKVRRFKSYTARQVVDYLEEKKHFDLLHMLYKEKLSHKSGQRYQVWQEGNHPVQISDREIMSQKIDYIHNNPLKRGYVDKPEHWRYSSAGDYAGNKGMLEIVKWY